MHYKLYGGNMTNLIYIVSRYLGEEKGKSKFHFIGYYNGLRITRVLVKGGLFEQKEDYVLAIKDIRCHKNTLYGSLIKQKKLFI